MIKCVDYRQMLLFIKIELKGGEEEQEFNNYKNISREKVLSINLKQFFT
jgi:hypothetical protein